MCKQTANQGETVRRCQLGNNPDPLIMLIYFIDKQKRMISEIFLHVGLHKTATTSIQKTLSFYNNKKFLENNNYIYPTCWPVNHSIPLYSTFCDHPEKYHINIKKGYEINKIKKVNKEYLDELEDEINNTSYSKLIISGEDISLLTINNLLNLKNYFLSTFGEQIKFNVMIFVRNPVLRAVSEIQEFIKNGLTEQTAIKYALKVGGSVFQNRIEKFIKIFGINSVKVHSFEEAIKHEFGPVGYFLSLLNITNDEITKFSYKKDNEGLSIFGAKFLSYVNEKIPPIVNGKRNENRYPTDIAPIFNICGSKYNISSNHKKTIFENSRSDIHWLRKNFGINYSFPILNECQNNFEITDEIIYDIKNTSPILSDQFKILLIEFIQEYCSFMTKDKTHIENLLQDLNNLKQ